MCFRQIGRDLCESYQKTAIIVTGLGVNTEKLSRKSRYYDRFGGEHGKAVKKKSLFSKVSCRTQPASN